MLNRMAQLVQPRRFHLSFFGKNLLLSTINIVLIAAILISASTFIQERVLVQSLTQQATGFAALAASEFELREVEEAFRSHEVSSPLHQQFVNRLARFKQTNDSVSQSYLYSADAVDRASPILLAVPQDYIDAGYLPGSAYEQSTVIQNVTSAVLTSKKAQNTGIYSNSYGQWLTVVQPILDANGNVIAAFAIDLKAGIVADGKKELLLWTMSVLAAALLVIFGIQFVMLRKLLFPIKVLNEAFHKMSEGKLNVSLPTDRKDELGQLNRRINSMAASLREMISSVQHNARLSTAQAKILASSSEQNSKALDEVSLRIREVASGAQIQEQVALDSSRSMEEMASGIQRVAESASSMADASNNMSQKAAEGNLFIEKVTGQMNGINRAVRQSSVSITALSKRSEEIVTIVSSIAAIASQTNLLALNAAIEAARAGEHGKGFAVVADEVRKLANQSLESANQIGGLIHLIDQEIKQTAQFMNEGTKEVEKGMVITVETGEKFQSIYASTQQVATLIQEVSAIAEQMSAGSEEVASAVQELSTIAEVSSKAAVEVARSAEEQLDSTRHVGATAAALNEMAQQLQRLIDRFKL